MSKHVSAGSIHLVVADWRKELDGKLPTPPTNPIEAEDEEQARTEKAAALAEVAPSTIECPDRFGGNGQDPHFYQSFADIQKSGKTELCC